MRKVTAEEVYDLLVHEDRILTAQGQIRFKLGTVEVRVRQKDVVGNILQEWFVGWLRKKGISFALNANTQMPPDLYLNSEDKTSHLLEIKAFNREGSPGFDIANFKSFQREIVEKPYMLMAKYLIFAYRMSEEGIVTITDVWLKSVWELCRSSEKWPLNVQYRNGIVYNIRPGVWYSTKELRFPTFDCLEDFLAAVEETVYQNPDTREFAPDWRRSMEQSFYLFYKRKITIPRWLDIKGRYDNNQSE